jgi:hypothetical protein
MEAPRFYLYIRGVRPSDQHEYGIRLGPWTSEEKAVEYSDTLTDSRIGEQLLGKLGVETLNVYQEA